MSSECSVPYEIYTTVYRKPLAVFCFRQLPNKNRVCLCVCSDILALLLLYIGILALLLLFCQCAKIIIKEDKRGYENKSANITDQRIHHILQYITDTLLVPILLIHHYTCYTLVVIALNYSMISSIFLLFIT